MFRLIDRSVLREVTTYLLLAAVTSTVILLAGQAADFGELLIKRNVPPAMIRTLLTSLLPRVLVITLPLSLLVGVMTGLARMTADHEITALFSAGISRGRLIAPVILLSLGISLVLLLLLGETLPHSYRQFREIRADLLVQGLRTQIKPRVFDDRFVNKVLYVGDIDRRSDRWNRILLILRENPASSPLLITARTGTLELGETPETSLLKLENGVIHRRTQENGRERYEVEAFDGLFLRFDAKSREAIEAERDTPSIRGRLQQMSLGELVHFRGEDPSLARRVRIELHKRVALSLAPVILALLGSALCLRPGRMRRGAGLTTSLFIALAYYLLFLAGENLARAGTVAPSIGVWAANAIFLALAVSVFRRPHGSASLWMRWAFTQFAETVEKIRSRTVQAVLRLMNRPPFHPHHGSHALPLILDRYIGRRFLSALLPALVGLWVLFLLFTLFELAPDIIAHRIPAYIVAEYCLYLTPVVVAYLLPPAVLLGAMICFSLLSRSSEMVAMKASGISLYRTTLPVLALCFILSLIVLWGENSFLPLAHSRQDALRFYIKQGRLPQHVELAPSSSSWIMSTDAWPETDASTARPATYRMYHFRRYDRWAHRFDHLLVVELDPLTFAPVERIESRWASWNPATQQWLLYDGLRWRFQGSRILSQEPFSSLFVSLPEKPEYVIREPIKAENLTTFQLARYIRYLAQTGSDTTELEVSLHRKNALAVACLVMGLFGIPFGIASGRYGALYAAGLGIGLGLGYWLLLDIFSQLGKYGYFDPAVAAWAPCGLLAAGGIYALFRLRT